MTQLTDGQEARRVVPGKGFWFLALLSVPVLDGVLVGATAGLANVNLPWFVTVAFLLAGAALLAQERSVKAMPPWLRVTWAVLGTLAGAAVALVVVGLFFAVLLYVACHGKACFS